VTTFLIYGTFMRGQPGHANLDGAEPLARVETAPRYRLWEIDGRWPALIEDVDGVSIAAELYEIAPAHLARLAEIEPSGWERAPVELADGRTAEAFLGDPGLRVRGHDVSAHGGWAAYRSSTLSRGRGS
jgi:allophanate hydrolase